MGPEAGSEHDHQKRDQNAGSGDTECGITESGWERRQQRMKEMIFLVVVDSSYDNLVEMSDSVPPIILLPTAELEREWGEKGGTVAKALYGQQFPLPH